MVLLAAMVVVMEEVSNVVGNSEERSENWEADDDTDAGGVK